MSKPSIIVLGGTGLIGAALCDGFRRDGHRVVPVNSKNYSECAGAEADVLINCNGNSYRYKAGSDPKWDFEASVLSVDRSLFDFKFGRYFYVSTIDVYNELADPARNHEDTVIDPKRLHPYGFHKWLAERLVERFATQAVVLRCGTVLGPALKKGPLFDLLENQPLRMSVDSEISFIDTASISQAMTTFVTTHPNHRIINLTGTGGASLRSLCLDAGLKWQAAAGTEQVIHRYNVNNSRLREVIPVRTSHDIAVEFLEGLIGTKT